jgi:hypothetical protein
MAPDQGAQVTQEPRVGGAGLFRLADQVINSRSISDWLLVSFSGQPP